MKMEKRYVFGGVEELWKGSLMCGHAVSPE